MFASQEIDLLWRQSCYSKYQNVKINILKAVLFISSCRSKVSANQILQKLFIRYKCIWISYKVVPYISQKRIPAV